MKCRIVSLSILALASLAAEAQAETKVYRDAEQAFLERTSLRAADEKCGYFTDLERAALEAGQLQARGALLRAGLPAKDIDTAANEVTRYANTQDCGAADFKAAVLHLQDAFSAFVGTMVMDFVGAETTWKASRSRWDTWRVVQDGSTDDYLFQFGLLAPDMSDPDAFPASFSRPLDNPLISTPFALAIDLFLDDTETLPSTARILIRDGAKSSEPWLGAIFSGEPGPPPRSITSAYWPSGQTLITEDDRAKTRKARFTFSDDATQALMKLDPRERVEIVIQPHARAENQTPVTLQIEVGDFAAAYMISRLPAL